ncbi:hypothetical protein HK097_011348 [Rhizophlyctis rosea]|uniref:AA9 family lytic polysaccharide monooxygenase n=1 Tax=Rhizophlyctis rosea TaxID=64517 RepID=A0AAD5S9J4_9FUNG|nr:hypothetical protein HK097_011348 [Rhizophlyctis rosea]
MKVTAILLAAAVSSASAHGVWRQVIGQADSYAVRMPTGSQSDSPITDVSSSAMACNNNIGPVAGQKVSVAAGGNISIKFWHGAPGNGDVIDSSHKGPVMAYLAKVSDSASSPAPSNGWFKIYESGYSGGNWAVDRLIAANGVLSLTIPSCIAPGDYLLRGELIALHGAGSYPGAQLYMECVQITVTGGGNTTPQTVSFPGAYSGTDPGIKFNLYTSSISYTIPGPRPFSCSGGGGQQPTTTQAPPRTTTTTLPNTTTQPPRTTTTTTRPPTTGGAPLYGQCGGQGWTGATTCAQGTCKFSNQWYSQCLP